MTYATLMTENIIEVSTEAMNKNALRSNEITDIMRGNKHFDLEELSKEGNTIVENNKSIVELANIARASLIEVQEKMQVSKEDFALLADDYFQLCYFVSGPGAWFLR